MDIQEQMALLRDQVREMMRGKDSLMEALGLGLEDILALAEVARMFVDQGQLDSAQAMLEGLVVLDPKNAYLHTTLGCVYMQKDLKDAAVEAFDLAIYYNPRDIAALAFSGELALERGLLDVAADRLRRAVELDPDGRDPHANRARTTALLMSSIVREVQQKGPEVLAEIVAEAERVAGESGDGS